MARACAWVCVAVLVVAVACGAQAYKAAVVEYAPHTRSGSVTRTEALAVMNQNVDAYATYMRQAKEQGAQIILFPEDGLYGPRFRTRAGVAPYLEPLPAANATRVPCDDADSVRDTPVLARMSCLAREHGLVVVWDMGDAVACVGEPGCPPDGQWQFNTQMAVDEHGRVLAKYHKNHLYGEAQFDVPPLVDAAHFTTSFGVTFGMLVCFDTMFGTPTLFYKHGLAIDHYLVSMWWVNFPNDLMANVWGQAWSQVYSANVLVSSSGSSWLTSGSGIFSSGRALASTFNHGIVARDRLLVASLPDRPTAGKLTPWSAGHMPDGPPPPASSHRTRFVPAIGTHEVHAASGPVACSITYTVSSVAQPAVAWELVAAFQKHIGKDDVEVCFLRTAGHASTPGVVWDRVHMDATVGPLRTVFPCAYGAEFALFPDGPTTTVQRTADATRASVRYDGAGDGALLLFGVWALDLYVDDGGASAFHGTLAEHA